MNNFDGLDLNLLVTLDTLLREQSVTRAAARLNLSQPSVSIQLAKLREQLNDPLLIPGPRGMRPTARAEALREPLHLALSALKAAVAPPASFVPKQANLTWRVIASDFSEQTVLLPALNRLSAQAPGCRLAIISQAPSRLAEMSERSGIDLAFNTREEAPPGLRSRVLFEERYVLTCRHDHPQLMTLPTLETFCELEHIVVSPEGGGFVGITDKALAAQGIRRRVALSVPRFSFAAAIVAQSDKVAVLPERLVRSQPGLRMWEPPVALPGFEMLMLWPERMHRDPAHRWLREQIVAPLGKPASA